MVWGRGGGTYLRHETGVLFFQLVDLVVTLPDRLVRLRPRVDGTQLVAVVRQHTLVGTTTRSVRRRRVSARELARGTRRNHVRPGRRHVRGHVARQPTVEPRLSHSRKRNEIALDPVRDSDVSVAGRRSSDLFVAIIDLSRVRLY